MQTLLSRDIAEKNATVDAISTQALQAPYQQRY
jgi:hypothetical protein